MREANQDKSVRETLVALRARQDESSYAPLVVLALRRDPHGGKDHAKAMLRDLAANDDSRREMDRLGYQPS